VASNEERPQYNGTIQTIEEYPLASPIPYEYMKDEEIHLRDYWRVLLRRKWTVLAFFLVVVTTVTIGTFMMTPVYRASVTLKIDKENPNILQIKDVLQVDRVEDDYYQTQYKILKSRNLAKRVIRPLKLYESPEFVDKKEPSKNTATAALVTEPTDSDPRNSTSNAFPDDIVDRFLNKLTVEPQQKSRLVKVSFDSYNAQLAADVANAIARSYIEFNVESKFDATQQARNWLEQQLIEMKAKVERSEESLNEYAARNQIIFVNDKSDDKKGSGSGGENIVTNKLSQMSTSLVQATSERIGKESLYRSAQQGDPGSNSIIMSSLLMQNLKKDSANLEAEYSQLLKVYKADYPKMRRLREQIKQLKTSMDSEIQKMIGSLKSDYEAALKKEQGLQATMEQYKSEALNLNDKLVQYQILKREVDTNKELYLALLQRMKETGISASITSSNIMVLDRAEVPKRPSKPKTVFNIMLSLIVGLLGGVGLAFFVEYLDNTVKSPDDVEKNIALPSLGLVPNFDKIEVQGTSRLIAFDDRKSPLSEAYRSIGTYIQFSSAVRPPRTILVTSAKQGEGKSTTSVNTAIALAHSVGKGIIIDADMRKPQLHKTFGVDNSTGLSNYLAGHSELVEGIIQQTKVQNLDIITAGVIPPNPSELLGAHRMRDLLGQLFNLYSFVLIDSPPVLGLSDSLILSTMTDGVILVVRAGLTSKDYTIQAKKLLYGVNAKILGVVLNGISASDLKYGAYEYYYSYYYEDGYGYGEKKDKKDKKDTKRNQRAKEV